MLPSRIRKHLGTISAFLGIGYLPPVVISPADPHKTVPVTKHITAPVPHYPAEALRKRWGGTGILEFVIRPDGTVSDVKILKSTGHRILDEEGVRAFRTWVFRPGTVDHVQVPLTFSLKPRPRYVFP